MNNRGIEDIVGVTLAEMGLSMKCKFVPFSQSRNKSEKYPSLNWKVTILKNEKEVLTTDYMAGCGHCPSYKQNDNSIYHWKLIKEECEKGIAHRYLGGGDTMVPTKIKILPELRDVIYSLVMDADAFEYDFEEWCANLGYDIDSRKAEKIYNECVEIAHKLLRSVGTSGLEKLRDAYQDY